MPFFLYEIWLDGLENTIKANAESLFDVEATLVLDPNHSYDGAEVSCLSQAAAAAEEIYSDANSTFTLEVTCKYCVILFSSNNTTYL